MILRKGGCGAPCQSFQSSSSGSQIHGEMSIAQAQCEANSTYACATGQGGGQKRKIRNRKSKNKKSKNKKYKNRKSKNKKSKNRKYRNRKSKNKKIQKKYMR